MSLDLEIDKLERRRVGLEQERERLHQRLQSLKTQSEAVSTQLGHLLGQPTSEQQQEALRAANHRLVQEYIETLDAHRLLAELLAKATESLAWWQRQRATLPAR